MDTAARNLRLGDAVDLGARGIRYVAKLQYAPVPDDGWTVRVTYASLTVNGLAIERAPIAYDPRFPVHVLERDRWPRGA